MKKLYAFFTLSTLLIISACQKDGCTDQKALNYNSGAKKDNHSCKYQSVVHFWFDETTSKNLQDDQIVVLEFYTNNRFLGSCFTSEYVTNMSQMNSMCVSYKSSIPVGVQEEVSYRVISETKDLIFIGKVTLFAGDTISEQLIY